jgi:(S)-mandelate dehydrogenase
MNETVMNAPVMTAGKPAAQASLGPDFRELIRRYPTIYHLREVSRKRLPGFAFDSSDGGVGADKGIQRNWNALDAVELMPRYGVTTGLPPTGVELFGQRYAAPIGIAPMGSPGIVWPGADAALASAAQRLGVPYNLSTVASTSLEEVIKIAPDVLWFQLYRYSLDNHRIGLDLAQRAAAVGAKVLVLTLDVPVRTTRTREVLSGITSPFRFTPKMVMQAMGAPAYTMAFLQRGIPRFGNFLKYIGENSNVNDAARFQQTQSQGAFTWEDVALYRDKWKGALVVKGIMHPEDAERAVALGIDGVQVSNHGGRQIEALPATIDVLPGVAAAVNGKAKVIFDSGVRSGLDVVRAMALGADFVLAGKAFLWGLGAMGDAGPSHTLDLFMDEMRATLGQIGAHNFAEARKVAIRHPGAFTI